MFINVYNSFDLRQFVWLHIHNSVAAKDLACPYCDILIYIISSTVLMRCFEFFDRGMLLLTNLLLPVVSICHVTR
jgi:hypothetical protein